MEAQEKLRRQRPAVADAISIEDADEGEQATSLAEVGEDRAATVMSENESANRLRKSMENPATSLNSGKDEVRSSRASRPFSAATITKQSEAGTSARGKSTQPRIGSAKP